MDARVGADARKEMRPQSYPLCANRSKDSIIELTGKLVPPTYSWNPLAVAAHEKWRQTGRDIAFNKTGTNEGISISVLLAAFEWLTSRYTIRSLSCRNSIRSTRKCSAPFEEAMRLMKTIHYVPQGTRLCTISWSQNRVYSMLCKEEAVELKCVSYSAAMRPSVSSNVRRHHSLQTPLV